MDAYREDFVYYGTRIVREEDASSCKKKAVAEASGQLRTLVPWRQDARDEEGRRRFQGAFTGGYTAGYHNAVGSREGWTPQSFTSSRNNRAEIQTQSVDQFLDDEERAELEGRSFATSAQFDTFGFTSAERARKHVEQETKNRPSAIPGPVPEEIVVPATISVGVKLLMTMGWRRGRSIKESGKSELDLPVYVINPKQDLHGLGYDPFKDAPEFREKKQRMLGFKSRRVAPGFGIGALEDLDVEDEDVFTACYDFEENHPEEIEEPSRPMIENVKLLDNKRSDFLPGFNAASHSDYQLEKYGPPGIPKAFVPLHKFTSPLFSSLFGGNGLDYYVQKCQTAENRGRILGEKPLERSLKGSATSSTSVENVALRFNLSDTFTGPAEVVKPFQEDPERFEQFLKEKYRGGLRNKDTSGSMNMTEAARVRERLEFDAAAQAIEKGYSRKENKLPIELLGDLVERTKYPKRKEFQWWPSALLCKRLKLADPCMGKLPPPPRLGSKMDSLLVVPEHVVKSEDKIEGMVDEDMVVELDEERPVDLYKAIFSDDTDNDEEENSNRVVTVANKTLNRLIAGDFLESLGKELGLEVPPDAPYSGSKEDGGNNNLERASKEERKTEALSHQMSDSLEDERERRDSGHRRKRSYSDSEVSDSSDDSRYHSRSKEKRKRSSREKRSSSRRHSKHHKHRHG